MQYIGIDIGKQGAVSVVNYNKSIIEKFPMPLIKKELDYQELYKRLEKFKEFKCIVVFEKLGVIFGSSKKTAFSMGEQSGAIEMLCISLSIPYVKVSPKTWQKEIFLGIPEQYIISSNKRDTKAMALLAVKRLFPNTSLVFGEKAKKPHDGLVDSLLIAEYARRKF